MKPALVLSPAVQFFVAAIVVLGLIGGSLIVAHSGFATSPRRGGPSTFVPAPQAYLLAATMYAMSFIGMLALLRNRQASSLTVSLAVCFFAFVAAGIVAALAPT
jgi:hypothetical protein